MSVKIKMKYLPFKPHKIQLFIVTLEMLEKLQTQLIYYLLAINIIYSHSVGLIKPFIGHVWSPGHNLPMPGVLVGCACRLTVTRAI